jgi:hypothetical protein
MVASGLIESQFYYAVFVLAAGALVIANVDATLFSLDALQRTSDKDTSRYEKTSF